MHYNHLLNILVQHDQVLSMDLDNDQMSIEYNISTILLV
jgi:hypothetical protein